MTVLLHLHELLHGRLDDSQALTALDSLSADRLDGEQIRAVWNALWALRPRLPDSLPQDLMDCCGTGGSGLARFNTSTCVAFVLAAAGVPTVKFGNRAATGRSGSFDFLEALGLPADPWPLEQLADRLDASGGLVFLSAAQVYPGLGVLARWRKAYGRPTIFNYLGPLLNPVRPAYRLMGLSRPELTAVLGAIATAHPNHRTTLMVSAPHPSGAVLDEVALDTPTDGHFWQGSPPVDSPWQYPPTQTEPLEWADTSTAANVAQFRAMLTGEDTRSPAFRLVCLNAAVAFWLRGRAATVEAGLELAHTIFKQGAVAAQVEQVVKVARSGG